MSTTNKTAGKTAINDKVISKESLESVVDRLDHMESCLKQVNKEFPTLLGDDAAQSVDDIRYHLGL